MHLIEVTDRVDIRDMHLVRRVSTAAVESLMLKQ